MGDAIIRIPPNSTDVNGLDILFFKSIGAGPGGRDVHIQAFKFADVYTYEVVAQNSALAANKHHLTIYNNSSIPSDVLRIQGIIAYAHHGAAVNGTAVTLEVQKITTAPTAGTTIAINKRKSTFPNLNAGITARIGATVTLM